FEEVQRYFSGAEITAPTLVVTTINAWNTIAISFPVVPGATNQPLTILSLERASAPGSFYLRNRATVQISVKSLNHVRLTRSRESQSAPSGSGRSSPHSPPDRYRNIHR